MQQRNWQKLFKNMEDPDMLEKFKRMIEEIESINEREAFMAKYLKQISRENLKNIQKSVMRRYNPYNDVGGDQSFSLVMLNGVNTGLILTSLHNRAGTRVYAKVVDKGVSDIQLSKEEKELLEQALTQS